MTDLVWNLEKPAFHSSLRFQQRPPPTAGENTAQEQDRSMKLVSVSQLHQITPKALEQDSVKVIFVTLNEAVNAVSISTVGVCST